MITPPSFLATRGFCTSLHSSQVVSPYWRKPNITASPADASTLRVRRWQRPYNLTSLLSANATGVAVAGCKGSFYGQMAEFDLITKQTMWEKSLKTYFQVYHALTYGRAAALAYAAYKDQTFLDYATQSWWFGRAYTLSQDDVSAGRISTKNISLCKSVAKITMVGGTFWLMDPVKPKNSLEYRVNRYFLVLSHRGGTNIYGSSWVGPPSSTYLGQDQTSALSALIAALVVAHDSVPSSSAPSTTFPATHPGKAKAVPIAVGIVGGVVSFRRARYLDSQKAQRC
ncbi:hypothetical protein B0H14DRAFT_3523445 [Mycena olivaceomarginata]|nr:hypothetical protein B0H14DRAFT_3523445 [Mycena olivaceomarginata]